MILKGEIALEDSRKEWIWTYTGKKFYFGDPTPESICIEDIAHAQSQLCRWTGHTKKFYSIAEHSYRVSVLCMKFSLRALLHDAAEAYINDINKPLKVTLGDRLTNLEAKIEAAVFAKYGLGQWDVEEFKEVKRCDLALAATEARDLINGNEFTYVGVPLKETIQPMGPLYAEAMFLERFRALTRTK